MKRIITCLSMAARRKPRLGKTVQARIKWLMARQVEGLRRSRREPPAGCTASPGFVSAMRDIMAAARPEIRRPVTFLGPSDYGSITAPTAGVVDQ